MKNKIQPGDWVQSNYRARWKGIVLAVNKIPSEDSWLVTAKQIVSQHGNVINKKLQKVVTYHMSYFEKINKPEGFYE